jgi:hypothetical protein
VKKDAKMKKDSENESSSDSEPEETVGNKSVLSARQQRANQRVAPKKPAPKAPQAKPKKRVVDSESENDEESEQYSEDE